MRIKELIKEFMDAFPELKEASLRCIEDAEGNPCEYIIFGDVFNPLIKENLPEIKDEELVRRIFNFLEKMATSESGNVRSVLTCGVLEWLGDDPEMLEVARAYMGSKTRRLSDRTEWAWGRTP